MPTPIITIPLIRCLACGVKSFSCIRLCPNWRVSEARREAEPMSNVIKSAIRDRIHAALRRSSERGACNVPECAFPSWGYPGECTLICEAIAEEFTVGYPGSGCAASNLCTACPTFVCEKCKQLRPWCVGAADDKPGECDDCAEGSALPTPEPVNPKDIAPPWALFSDGGQPIAILPAGRPGEVASVVGMTAADAQRIVDAANALLAEDPAMPPPDVIESMAKHCRSCGQCGESPPCATCMAGGVCLEECRCHKDRDRYDDDDDDDVGENEGAA